MGRVLVSGRWVPIGEVMALLDRTYKRDKDGKFSSGGGGGGPGVGKDITGDTAAMEEIYAESVGPDGAWKDTGDGDRALRAIVERQGFDAPPTVVPAAEFDAYVRDGGHTVMYRGVNPESFWGEDKWETKLSAADVHTQLREGDFRPGYGVFGNGTYMAPGRDKAESFGDGTPGSVGTYALHRDARTITYTDLRDRYDREVYSAPDYDLRSAKTGVTQDFGRYAAALGYDAIHVPVGTPMFGGSKVQREEYVILNRGALIASEPE